MSTTVVVSVSRGQEELTTAAIPGLLALGVASVLQALPVTPLHAKVPLLLPALLLCALVQLAVGLHAWHRRQPFLAVTFTAFGLFTCSRLPQLASSATDPAALTGQASLLLFWALFALFMSSAATALGRAFQIVLGGICATLLLMATLLVTGWSAGWPLPLAAGSVVLVATGFAIRHAAHD